MSFSCFHHVSMNIIMYDVLTLRTAVDVRFSRQRKTAAKRYIPRRVLISSRAGCIRIYLTSWRLRLLRRVEYELLSARK